MSCPTVSCPRSGADILDDNHLKETIIAQAQRIAYLESTIHRLASESPPQPKDKDLPRRPSTPPPLRVVFSSDLLADALFPRSLPSTPKKSDSAKALAQEAKIPEMHVKMPDFSEDFLEPDMDDLPEIPSSPLFGLPMPPMKASYDSTIQDIEGEKGFALDDISLLDAHRFDFDPRTLGSAPAPSPILGEDTSRPTHGYFPSIPCYYPSTAMAESHKEASTPLAVQCAEAICASTPMHSVHPGVQPVHPATVHHAGAPMRIPPKAARRPECPPRFRQPELPMVHHRVLVSPPAIEAGAWIPPQQMMVAVPEEAVSPVPRVVFGPPAPPKYPPPKRGKPRRIPRPKGTVPPPPDHYTCHRCKQKGHWIEDCDMPRIIGPPPAHYVCHRCHFRGHWIEDCEKESALRTEMFMMPPASYVCKGCGEHGHWARHCPFL